MSQTLASGKVSDRPFARLYYTLGAKKISGELIIETQGRQIKSLWKDGLVYSAESPLPNDSPARIGLSKGLLLKGDVASVVDELQGKTSLQSLALLLERLKLPEDKSEALKNLSILQAASRQLAFEDATFVLKSSSEATQALKKGLNPKRIIWEGLKQHYSLERLQKELAPLGTSALKVKEGVDVGGFGFDDSSLKVVKKLEAIALAIPELLEQTGLDPSIVLSAAYVLVASDSASVSKSSLPLTKAEAQSKVPPTNAPKTAKEKDSVVKSSGRQDEIKAIIKSKIQHMENDADYFTLLGVEQGVDAATLQKSYFGLAKRLHPDKLQAMGLELSLIHI